MVPCHTYLVKVKLYDVKLDVLLTVLNTLNTTAARALNVHPLNLYNLGFKCIC